jgi:hypothetical protein
MSLAELFPDGDYRFHLTLRRAEPREFFGACDSSGAVRAERTKWLDANPTRYAAILPEGEPVLREFAAMASAWIPDLAEATPAMRATELLRRLGCALEPDVLFLTADDEDRFRLRGGALCFPSGWALEEKIGHTLDFIHGVVPGLNGALGGPIHQFLSKLKPGPVFLRDNWGVAASEELNLHPARSIAGPELPALDRLWLRVEHQALMALPVSRGLVFGIRIAHHRLDGIAGGPHARSLRRALATMPPELVAYKRLDCVRDYLLNVL